jgi:hypothetical protein
MLRFAALTIFTGIIWFTLNDSPAVTKSTGEPAGEFAPPTRSAVNAPKPMLGAQAQAEPAVQSRRTRKARPHLRISPRYPYRRNHVVYPLPYDIEYPGPRGVRHCVNRYVTERRPSGTVVVPRMRCWWTRG